MENQSLQENTFPRNEEQPLNGYERVRNEILKKIINKHYVIGTVLRYQDHQQTAQNKPNYQRALYFLEGAGIQVNGVIISDKVPKELSQRIGLVHE
ncbi:hypothetical protein [Listeria sp. ILCC797]|uniref:hypothetical protein n=1 Tax=Listeria sp. ILCC797 TaxID=1918333 RepID=UPI000B59800A|nr:hypothetical protein [Listeria sp. ILCC797]